ncbi:CocE/NonD family hydrolase [Aureispira anguillae]|uniref:CocE/NonD family hydrolase n=1 Tax=Aureispira anguillae TaxID=2864201 RepID=A0A915YK92_9BACT|nr:CocE/NonD family hydrolase [Aureispira anguillae]BDS14758.1 CocE/NonD family hydrolase [Aureispira anguillae]
MRVLVLFCLLFISTPFFSQTALERGYAQKHYDKAVYKIPMRDGVHLYTVVYSPKDQSKSYPFLMQRTCYSVRPYEKDVFRSSLGPSPYLMEKGYIFVYQDVRGRYMSEGTFDNMRPHIEGNDLKNTTDIDESSDTYDTIDWLLKNIKNNNGRVGQWGISYPGFYTAAALPEAHPALKASSPQAPISDFFFDDFHHMGACLQSYLKAFPVFGIQKKEPTTKSWYNSGWDQLNALELDENNAYEYHKALGPIKNVSEVYTGNFFWEQMVDHPNYDDFWQKRSILPHLKEVNHAVMTVGGWFDAEDLYGPLNIYKNIERNNTNNKNTLVMGPWSHGDWSKERGIQAVNHIYFGEKISTFYQKTIELPFFEFYLKDEGEIKLPEAYLFDTGIKEWKEFQTWPPKVEKPVTLRFAENNQLLIDQAVEETASFSYISDPNDPVPHRSEIVPVGFTPRKFMTDDQRHAARRKDVLTFETEILEDDFTLAGEIMAQLSVALSTTDADFVVKLIDVYPENAPATKATPANVEMGGYQQLVRSEVFRGRFRKSFSTPQPFVPHQVEQVDFPLQDILHTFKKGHRIMIQIHSTWFPYIDRNPQKYVDNIYKAQEADFVKSQITIYGSSKIVIGGNNQFAPK